MVKKITLAKVKKYLPSKKTTANKTQSGKTLIIAGSEGFYGAAILSAKAALRIGSGYVILMTHLKNLNLIKNPDFLVADYSTQKIKKIKFNSAGIGPGLGVTKKTEKSIKELLKLKIEKVVVDADALTVIAKKRIYPLPPNWVMTPHEGEMARLLNTTSQKVRANRLNHIKMATDKYKCIVLLKGHHTLISYKNDIFEIQTGNAALAKAGTGDVLTGMIAGLMAQGLESLPATLLASTIHGSFADQWVKRKDKLSLIASDLVEMLPSFLFKIRT